MLSERKKKERKSNKNFGEPLLNDAGPVTVTGYGSYGKRLDKAGWNSYCIRFEMTDSWTDGRIEPKPRWIITDCVCVCVWHPFVGFALLVNFPRRGKRPRRVETSRSCARSSRLRKTCEATSTGSHRRRISNRKARSDAMRSRNTVTHLSRFISALLCVLDSSVLQSRCLEFWPFSSAFGAGICPERKQQQQLQQQNKSGRKEAEWYWLRGRWEKKNGLPTFDENKTIAYCRR